MKDDVKDDQGPSRDHATPITGGQGDPALAITDAVARVKAALANAERYEIGGAVFGDAELSFADIEILIKGLEAFDWVAGMYDDRSLTRDDIAAELSDYMMILDEVPLVYDHVTGGRISKPNTHAKAVIAVSDDYFTELVGEEVKEALERLADGASSRPPVTEGEGSRDGHPVALDAKDAEIAALRADLARASTALRAIQALAPATTDLTLAHEMADMAGDALEEMAASLDREGGVRIGCRARLTAQHRDLIMDEGLHEHTWTFTAWFEGKPFRDLRSQRAALQTVLAPYQGTELPPEMWASEDMAQMFAKVLGGCIGVTVERDDFVAEVKL